MRFRIPALILILILAAPAVVDAKSFSLDRVHADVTVGEDGTARVVESLTYTFDGKFSYGYRTIPLRSGDDITDISVSEGSNEYSQSISEIPGSFILARTGNELKITWYYRARNETRTFRIAYTMSGACTRYADIGEFYYKVFDNQTGARVDEVSIRVELPGNVSPTDMRVYAHGPLHGEVRIDAPSILTARVAPLWNRRYFEVRVLLPEQTFAGMASTGQAALQAIVDQEAEWARQADEERERQARRREAWRAERERRSEMTRRFLPVTILLAAVALITWFMLFRRHGWPHEVTSRIGPGSPPTDHPPALVSYLIARTAGGPALVATLVDLSERGHVTIAETTYEKRGWFGSAKTGTDYRFERTRSSDRLRPFESDLLRFVFDEVGDGRSFTLSEFKKHAGKKRTAVRKWFVAWTKMVKEEGRRENFFEPYDTSAVLMNVAIGLGIAAVGLFLTLKASSPVGLPAIICGVLAAVLSVTFTRHTPEARRLAVAWKEFHKHLKSMSRGMGRVSLTSDEWSRYLAIAIVFGMHDKLLPQMDIAGGAGAHGYPAWYAATSGHGGVSGMADGLSAMVSSVSSTMSSSTGAGGGASGGGGGGAGGGSAGAG